MNLNLLIDNLTSPALLFFVMGILAVQLKSDLEIPKSSSKFISLYLLFSIGFNGGRELAHSEFSMEIIWTVLFGIITALVIPVYTFYLLRRRLSIENSGAIAAAYGSISAVTFVTAVSFLEIQEISYSGHMVALMALMEAPAIIVGVTLISLYGKKDDSSPKMSNLIGHSFSNGSVLMILGSLIIGFVASESQAQGITPFTNDIFKGFLAIFLLDMGIISGRKLADFIKSGWFTTLFAIVIPVVNGCTVAWASGLVTGNVGDRFILAILAASASYIAVPAAMKMAVPKANPGLYLPMALAVTFPFNITFGMPLYMALIVL